MVHIFLRSRTYYARIRLPSDLRAILDRSILKRSLGTRVYRVAQVRACHWAGMLAQLFTRLRRERTTMTKADMQRLVQEYLTKELDEMEEEYVERGYTDDERETLSLVYSDRLEDTTTQLLGSDYTTVEDIATELLSGASSEHEFKRLCRELLKANQILYRTALERLEGRYWEERPVAQTHGQGGGIPAHDQPSITVGQAATDYFTHYQRNRVKQTNDEKKVVVRRFIETLPLGETTPLHRVKKPEAIVFRDAYGQLPARIPNKYRGVPIRELLEALKGGDYVRVTASTVNHALTDLRHFFVWAMRHDHYLEPRNPFNGIDLEGITEEHYDAYTNEELTALFTDPVYLKQRKTYPARYWLPYILLYTGARRGEIDQLTSADIKQEGEVYYFDITDDPETGKRAKNAMSKRRVPIHSRLIELGLLEYWKVAVRRKMALLFPKQEEGRGARGSREGARLTCGDSVSKWHRGLRKRLGIAGKKALHSFRDTVITALLSAGCAEDLRKVLTGHAAGDVHGDVYVKRGKISLVLLKEKIELLKFPV